MFDRFTATQDETVWYYRSLSELFSRRLKGLRAEVAARELAFTVSEIDRLAAEN